ncbi:hypothetical protein BDV06DRAFT_221641 [Aspergillus oleicola]
MQNFRLFDCTFATTTAAILRPSPGETIILGAPYTISWVPSPPNSGPLVVELFGNVGAIHGLGPNDISCDRWLINTECDKFDVDIPGGSTSYVWNLSKPYDYWRLLYDELPFTLGIYEDNLEYGELPETDAEWYWSEELTLAAEGTSTTSTTTRSGTTTTSTTTDTPDSTLMASSTTNSEIDGTDGANRTTDDRVDTAIPTDAGSALTPGGR